MDEVSRLHREVVRLFRVLQADLHRMERVLDGIPRVTSPNEGSRVAVRKRFAPIAESSQGGVIVRIAMLFRTLSRRLIDAPRKEEKLVGHVLRL